MRDFRDGRGRQLQGNNATGSADAITGMAGQGVAVISWSAAARRIAFKAQHEFDRCRAEARPEIKSVQVEGRVVVAVSFSVKQLPTKFRGYKRG